jgi:hypothetical protein
MALLGCDSDGGTSPVETASGEPRTYELGFSSLPAELTETSYEQAFSLAGGAGDVIMIQRTPPWEELIAGDVSAATASTTRRERQLAAKYGLELFVAIDPTDVSGERSELAGLPAELRGAGFADERIRRAFVEYARYVALNYRPKYLALGVDINSYQHAHPEDFERFVSLYHEAYIGVKELSPETLVFPIFQLEELQGLLPLDEPNLPQWFLVRRFANELDLFAASSYPELVFADPELIPPNYFTQIRAFTDQPIALAGTGHSSGGDDGEALQGEYLFRLIKDADQLSMGLVVWLAGQDPSYVGENSPQLTRTIGLVRADGTTKPAWNLWGQMARRPLEAAATPTN